MMAQTVTYTAIGSKKVEMKIPESIKKSVVFLGVEVRDGTGDIIPRATGFFVSVPSVRNPTMSCHYMVTAKHVMDQLLRERCFFITMNSKQGELMNLKAVRENVEWHVHPTDDSADVALFSIHIHEAMDLASIPLQMLLKSSEVEVKGIGPSDDLFIVGLFSHHAGFKKNVPIVRTGNIAMIPGEPVVTSYSKSTKTFGGAMEAYLIESRSIGGLSGSPVFVVKPSYTIDLSNRTGSSTGEMFLMGLMHGHWTVESDTVVNQSNEDVGVKAGVNVGIAIVVPAQKIIDIIERPELVEDRRKMDERP